MCWQVPASSLSSRCSVSLVISVTYDVFHEDKEENIANIEVELGEDHAGDVGGQEDQDQTEDAEQIFYFHFPIFLRHVSCSPDCVEDADNQVGHTGHGGATHGGQDDGQADRGDALVGRDVVAHRAGQVHLLAQELVGHQAVQQGDQPDGAQCDFVGNSQLAEMKILVFLSLCQPASLSLRQRDGQVNGGDLLLRALQWRHHTVAPLQPSQPREDGEPGEDCDGPGQDGPGEAVAEAVQHAEGDVGLAGVGRHCVGVVNYGD